jgi:citrate lyase subunit beta/citryl-CoA lyase
MRNILRSFLFVPGDSPPKMTKAAQTSADALILDWEDAALPEQKAFARETSLTFLSDNSAKQPIWIRTNPATGSAFQQDAEALRKRVPAGVVLSKCRSAEDVVQLQEVLDSVDPAGECSICPMVESPQSLLVAFSIATASPRVSMVAFGAEDFSAEMRINRTADDVELLYARSAFVTACRAAGKEPIDSPCLDFRDLNRVKATATRARNLGFGGGLAIHPSQITVLNEVFSPSPAEIEEAQRLIDLFSSAASGVVALDGKMVDEAVVRRARMILKLAR